MDILQQITNFLNQKWLPNLVGLTGGILGAATFVDNYIINFKPKIFVGTRVVLHFVEENTVKQNINSIICSMEICNHRKKYGVIYNLAARIYRANEINPQAVLYYATETLNKIPIDVVELGNEELLSYTPITVLPNSNKSVNVALGGSRFSKMHTRAVESFHLELFYQIKPNGKWYFIDKIYLYNDKGIGEIQKDYHRYIALENDLNKDKLAKEIRPQKTSIYTGIFQRYIDIKYRTWYYRLITYPLNTTKDLFMSFAHYGFLWKDYFIDTFIKFPLLKKQGKYLLKSNVKINNPEFRPDTRAAFESIYNHFDLFIKEINEGAKNDALITLSKRGENIVLSRFRLSIVCYISGDTSINVQEENFFGSGSKVNYSLRYRKGLWKNRYWFLENYGVISIKSFSIRVIDTLILHSNTR